MRKIFIISWGIFAILYTFFFDIFDHSYYMVFKLIPMVLVILLAVTSKHQGIAKYYTLLVTGLIFCTIGDYTLQWFIVGLSAFLIGHLFYISAFLTTQEARTPRTAKLVLLAYGLIMLLWVAGTLWSGDEYVLAVAVCFYIFAILTMGWTSFRTGSRYAMFGAALFIVSDSILALNRFILDIPFSHELIMGTYYGAQILIALSISQYSEIRNKVLQ